MRELVCLLFCGFISSTIVTGYVYVVAPNTFRFDHDETIVIGVFNEIDLAVQVWLEIDGGQPFSHINNVVIHDESQPQSYTVRVREHNLYPEDHEENGGDDEKPRTVKIVTSSKLDRQETTVSLSYNTGYLFVQTDKPIYTPRQTIRVRTLVLDETMKPAPQWNVTMDLISPKGQTMARARNNKHEEFIRYSFPLPPKPDLGIWTIKAFCSGQLETQARTTFAVREYVLPRFGVDVDVDIPFILEAEIEETFTVTVTAEYVYKKKVKGTSALSLYLKTPDGEGPFILKMDRLALENGVSEYQIKRSDIFNSAALKGQPFPTGAYLECRADVLEEVTGKTELGSHSQTIFAVDKFKFDFTQSKTTYHPGMEYYLRLTVYFANGEPATDIPISLQADIDGDMKYEGELKTDMNGYVMALVNTDQLDQGPILIQATSGDYRSATFNVNPYKGENQMQVEHVIKDKDTMMQAITNVQAGRYTGMLFVIVSRGKIVYTKYKDSAIQAGEKIDEIERVVSPSARLLAFYVDTRSNKVVADSVKFNVEPVCRGPGLSLHVPTAGANIPRGTKELTVTGTPGMRVGLNVMDKALLLLKRDSVMRKSQMFEAMESHDLGCGVGSGQISEEIFMNAGLALVGNVDFNVPQAGPGCADRPVRRKRSQGCFANGKCCDFGKEFAENRTSESGDALDPYLTCYPKARELQQAGELPMKCILAFYEACVDEIKQSSAAAEGKSLGSGSDYEEDLKHVAGPIIVRKDFKESWLFEEITLDKEGKMKKKLLYPDSITEWMIQGIGVSPENGLCIAEPVNITVFKDFFLELDIPYQVVRMEHLDIKATIYNYGLPGDRDKRVSFYLQGTENICSNVLPGKHSKRREITVGPNSAESVTFPIIPLEAGKFKITAVAIVTNGQVSTYDAVEKDMYVVNEGVEERITINLCLDPKQQMEDCSNHPRITRSRTLHDVQTAVVDLALPHGAIPSTGSATAYLSANIMTGVVETVLENVEKLFVMPSGCGEQVASKLAPTVYATSYLKRTDQVTPEIEETGNNWVRDGVNLQYGSYFQEDTGGYAAYKSRPPSTWLSAFVVKVFCQAKDAVDDAVDEAVHVIPTIQWLTTNVNADGSFFEAHAITGWGIGVGLMGNMGIADVALTPFVLIALTECSGRYSGLESVYANALSYVENLPVSTLTRNPYLLAISTYALALTDSPEKWNFKNLLMNSSMTNTDGMYWGSPGVGLANSASVETTGYALLATMLFDDMKTSGHIVRWLTAQWEANGAFRTTQDTVVALQALSTYSRRTVTRDTNLDVTMVANNWPSRSQTVTSEQSIVRTIIRNLPVEKDNSLSVEVSGKGTGRMVIDLRYNRPRHANETCQFDVSEIKMNVVDDNMDRVDEVLGPIARRCDVCGFCKDDPDSDDVDYDDKDKFFPLVNASDSGIEVAEPGVVVDFEDDVDQGFGRKKREARRRPRATERKICIRFSVRSRTTQEYGMSIVEFGLETGMTVVESDIKKMETDRIIDRYEMPTTGKGYVIFYLSKIGVQKTSFTFRLKDTFAGDPESRHPAAINVYDYYRPENKCKKYYGTGSNNGEDPLQYKCKDEEGSRNCRCVQTMCSRSWERKIIDLADKARKNRRKTVPPAIQLARRTCDNAKADFAVFVEIQSTDFDPHTLQKLATGVVIRSIHKGKFDLKRNDEMSFYWKMSCAHPKLEEGHKYWIIAKDGVKSKDKNEEGEVVRYQLMDTAMIVEKPKRGKKNKLTNVMLNYEKVMRKQQCAH